MRIPLWVFAMPLKDLTSVIGPANWRNVGISMIPIIQNLPTNPRLRVLTLSLPSLETNSNLRIPDPPTIDFLTLDLPPLNPNPPMLVSLVQMERSPKLRKIDVVKKGYVCTVVVKGTTLRTARRGLLSPMPRRPRLRMKIRNLFRRSRKNNQQS